MRKGHLEFHLLVFVTLSLVAFGLVMVYSATSAPAALGGGEPTSYLKRQAIYGAFGLALLIAAARLDFRAWRKLAPLLVVSSLALCAAVLVLGPPINGARRWLVLGPATFQPSELAKLAVAVWVAAYLARRPAPQSLVELVRPVGIVAALFFALLLAEPDLGTTVTIVVMLGAVLLVAGTPARLLALAGTAVLALGVAAIWFEPYRRARFFAFLNPWADPQDEGFQTIQATIAIGSGGPLGNGLGESVGKIYYLPEAHTDMIFAIIGEELGLVGSLGVIGAYAAFAYAGFSVALAARDPFGKRLAVAITALVCGQAAINLAAVLGLAPLTGIPLPFVSAGGSSLVVLLACVGVLLNIAVNDAADREARVPDRGGGDGRARPARARDRGRAAEPRRRRDVRRDARPRRGAARS